MNWIEAFFLGIVQGITEFFPVSSSGHLIIVENLMQVHMEGILFEVAVHFATLIAVLVFYRKRIKNLAVGILNKDGESIRYICKLCVATIPAVIIVLIAGDFIEDQFNAPVISGICLILTGVFLLSTRYTIPLANKKDIMWRAALIIGCAQAFAILPGISRSGATVVTALALGVEATVAAEFSFLMSVIAIFGAVVLKAPELMNVPGEFLTSMIVGGIAALASGLLAISLFVRFLKAQCFHRFAYYALAVGFLFLGWLRLS